MKIPRNWETRATSANVVSKVVSKYKTIEYGQRVLPEQDSWSVT
jgi:hypothetical protein